MVPAGREAAGDAGVPQLAGREAVDKVLRGQSGVYLADAAHAYNQF